jgi:hypothetical protein
MDYINEKVVLYKILARFALKIPLMLVTRTMQGLHKWVHFAYIMLIITMAFQLQNF